jgi:rare lipoprotein A (peptidoglycan hydrolase)
VAHKTLRCGTLVIFEHGGVEVTAPVVDRGPFTPERTWDLSRELCARLNHCFTGPIRWRLA